MNEQVSWECDRLVCRIASLERREMNKCLQNRWLKSSQRGAHVSWIRF